MTPPTSPAASSAARRVPIRAGFVGLVIVLLAGIVVVASGPVDYVSAPPRATLPAPTAPARPTATLGSATTSRPDLDPSPLPGWLLTLGYAVLAAVAVILAYLLARLAHAFLTRPRRPNRPLPQARPVDPLPEVPEHLTGAAAQARRELLARGEPRNAVVACWVDLEESAAATGLPRRPAETSTEYLARVLATWQVDPAALTDLAALFREARFSDHPVGEPHRARALADLDRLHTDLARAAAQAQRQQRTAPGTHGSATGGPATSGPAGSGRHTGSGVSSS